MADLDIATKVLLREAPGAMLRLALGDVGARNIHALDTVFPATETRADKVLAYEADGSSRPRHLHFEVFASPRHDDARRTHAYWTSLYETLEDVRSNAIYLRRAPRQGSPTGRLVVGAATRSRSSRSVSAS
jgi:hypothetical protein